MPQTLLIVDDSTTTRAMIRRIATSCGIEDSAVLEAADAREALDVLDSNDVDLVLADLHMPDMDGLALTRRIIDDPTLRHVPVVIVSADPAVARIEDLKAQGARGYLAKPFTPESLGAVLDEVLGVRAAHAA